MQLDATGTATDSQMLRRHAAAHGVRGAPRERRAQRPRERRVPAISIRRASPGTRSIKGTSSGTVDATFGIASICRRRSRRTPITADGAVTLAKSEVAGLTIDSADVQGQYANRRGTLRQATVKGPDVDITGVRPDRARPGGADRT